MVVYGDIPFIRYSDFPLDKPMQIVIKDITLGQPYKNQYVFYSAFFPFDKDCRLFNVIFPAHKFKKEYLKYPVDMRMEIGNEDILITLIKHKKNLEFTSIEAYKYE